MSTGLRVWVRRFTAGLMVSGLVVIASLVTSRARTLKLRPEVVRTDEVPGANQSDAGPIVAEYQGFRYVETVAGEVAFALSSARTLGTSSGWHEINGVQLALYQHGEVGAVITCDAAAFNIQTHDARLNGEVHLRLPGGAMVTTEHGHFEAGSRELVTDSETAFISDRAIGRAARARYSVTDNRLELDGRVNIQSREGASLAAPHLVYEREQGRITLPEGCRLSFGQGSVEGPRAALQLEGREGPPQQVDFEGGVVLAAGDGTSTLDGWTERLTARRDPSGSWQFQASTSGPWVTLVVRDGTAFYERALRTWFLRGVAASAGILTAVAEGGVCLSDVPVEGGTRSAESSTAQVWFEGSAVSEMELDGGVTMRGEDGTASGARARVASRTGLVMLHADPAGRQRAVLVSARGTMSADQIQLREAEGRAEARSNVQGELRGVAVLGTQGSRPGTPLHFAADGLTTLDRGQSFDLKGNARTWQGRRLLQADEIHYRQVGQQLHAAGHVRTIVPAQELKAGAPPPGDAVVEARSLDYDGAAHTAVYFGDVKYVDGSRTLEAAELDLRFDDNNQISELEALGGVEIVDLPTGRKMEGQRACRDTATETMTMEGLPVQLTDEKGNVVSGSSLTWEEASGRVTISGGPGSPTETIFRPENASTPVPQLGVVRKHTPTAGDRPPGAF